MSSFRRKSQAAAAPRSTLESKTSTENKPMDTNVTSPSLADTVVNRPVMVSLGIKPSVYNSLGLVSSGHKQLDDLLGGGLQLGTALLIGSDLHSSYADTMLGYGLAEGVSMHQPCLLLTADSAEAQTVLESLPYNRTIGSNISDTKSQFCCSYDLSRQLQPGIRACDCLQCFSVEDPSPALLHTISDVNTITLRVALDRYVARVTSFVQKLGVDRTVGRVHLHSLHNILTVYGGGLSAVSMRREAVSFLLRLKMIVRSARVALVISVLPEALPGSTGVASSLTSNSTEGGSVVDVPLQAFIAVVDSALTVDTFAGRSALVPYEFQEFCGFLVVERVQHLGALVGHRPSALRYGLKRDRRKLHIEFLHLPPEESRAQGSAGTDARLEERSRAKAEAVEAQKEHVSASSTGQGSHNSTQVVENINILIHSLQNDDVTPPVVRAGPPSDTATSEEGVSGSIPQGVVRQYRRLNLGKTPAAVGGVSISKFRKAQPALAPGAGCSTGGIGKAGDLEF